MTTATFRKTRKRVKNRKVKSRRVGGKKFGGKKTVRRGGSGKKSGKKVNFPDDKKISQSFLKTMKGLKEEAVARANLSAMEKGKLTQDVMVSAMEKGQSTVPIQPKVLDVLDRALEKVKTRYELVQTPKPSSSKKDKLKSAMKKPVGEK